MTLELNNKKSTILKGTKIADILKAKKTLIASPTYENISKAASLLRKGHLVAFPSETVYGLGADAMNSKAVASIFVVKGRPSFNPLIVHVRNLEEAEKLGEFNQKARHLASAFWPGPLTLVVRRRETSRVCELATAGLNTIAIRVPKHPVAQALLEASSCPIAAPSANKSGHVSPTRASHVADDLKNQVGMILEGGSVQYGIESTVINATQDTLELLRFGVVSLEEISEKVGYEIALNTSGSSKILSPGQLGSHYAPQAELRLEALEAKEGEALLAFGKAVPAKNTIINLSPNADLIEAAANLYTALRGLDSLGASHVAVMPIPENGIGIAINDRLRRAATPRKN